MRGSPKIPGEARRINVQPYLPRELVAQPRPIPQMRSLCAFGAIVDRVERQDRVRQHLRLQGQVFPPDLQIEGRELFRLKPQVAECRGSFNSALKQHLPSFDVRLALEIYPLIAAMLNEERPPL